jgi:methylated-DNA-protein-cysteine methyltransferase-like protein
MAGRRRNRRFFSSPDLPASSAVVEAEPPPAPTTAADSFAEAVWALVREVPAGQVTTYGWLARRLGRPRNARLVGYVLHGAPFPDVPCQRVVNRDGRLSGAPHFGPPGQKALLEAEGVTFRPDGRVDLRHHLWRPAEE